MEIREPSRGYILEVFDAHFVLPNLGPIGMGLIIIVDKIYDYAIKWRSQSSGGHLLV